MKKFLVAMAFCANCLGVFSQTMVVPQPNPQGKLFLGVGVGLNNGTTGIIGLRLDGRVSEQVMLGVGVGVSGWGGRISFNGHYITKSNWCPMIGISRSGGADSVVVPMELNTINGLKNEDVALRLKPVTTILLGVEKQWFTMRGNRFFMDLGYAIPTGDDNTPFSTVDPTKSLSSDSVSRMRLQSPGGLVLGFGYSLRLN